MPHLPTKTRTRRPPRQRVLHDAPAILGPETPTHAPFIGIKEPASHRPPQNKRTPTLRELTAPPAAVTNALAQTKRNATPRENDAAKWEIGGRANLNAPRALHQNALNTQPGLLGADLSLAIAQQTENPKQLRRRVERGIASIPAPQRTNVIAGFPDANLYPPAQRAALAKKYGLPPNPSDAQILRAIYQPRRSFVGDVAHNFLPDLLSTPAGVAAGGYAAGVAARQALGGNFKPARELAAQSVLPFEHPLQFTREHPFQALLTAYGGIKATGGAAGKLAGVEESPRFVVPAGSVAETATGQLVKRKVSRGVYSANLVDRAAQKVADARISRNPAAADRFLRREARTTQDAAHDVLQNELRRNIEPVTRELRGLNRHEQRAVVFAHGQGVTPSRLADFYEQRLAQERAKTPTSDVARATQKRNTQSLEAAAKLWRRTAEKTGDTPTPRMQAALNAARTASQNAEARLLMLRDPAGNPLVTPGQLASRAALPQRVVNETLGDQPLRGDTLFFPHRANARGLFARGSSALGRTAGNPEFQLRGRLGENTGARLALGRASTTPETFLRALAEPDLAHAVVRHVQAQASRFGLKAKPGMLYDPNEWVLLDVAKSGQQLADVAKRSRTPSGLDEALSETEHRAGFLDALKGSFSQQRADGTVAPAVAAFKPRRQRTGDVAAPEGDWVLFPRAVYKAIHDAHTPTLTSTVPGVRRLADATRAWRWWTLLARPGWVATNLVGNTVQSALAGVGPTALARAARGRYRDVIPASVENQGFVAGQLAPRSGATMGREVGGLHVPFSGAAREIANTAEDEGRLRAAVKSPTIAVKHAGNLFAQANTDYENLMRRAVYLRHAVPEAKRKLIAQNAKATNDAILAELRKAKTAEEAAPRIAQKVTEFLGTFGGVRRNSILDVAVPFHRWLTFISRFVLYTLPVKYPGRALLLDRLGSVGLLGGNQLGILPPSLQGAIPAGTSGTQNGEPLTRLIGTRNFNPFATVTDIAGFAPTTTGGGLTGSGLVQGVNPFLQGVYAASQGIDPQSGAELRDQAGNPIRGNTSAEASAFANQLATSVPLVTTLAGTNLADTAIPGLGGARPASPLDQPQKSLSDRLLQYATGVNVRDFNLAANEIKRFKALNAALKTEYRNKLKAKAAAGG